MNHCLNVWNFSPCLDSMEGVRHLSLGDDQSSETSDRLSELPNCLVLYILSFLPIKDAVGTSILAKRWRNLWIDLPVLYFYWDYWMKTDKKDAKDYIQKKISFKNFVNRVLLLNRAPVIERCTLCNLDDIDSTHKNAWITALSARQVQELALWGCAIDMVAPDSAEFSRKLFSFESLSVLELYLAKSARYAPNVVRFWLPNLKILHLSELGSSPLHFDDDFLNRLVAGCKVLEELSLDISNFISIEIHSSTLITLDIYGFSTLLPYSREVILEASNLKRLNVYSVNLSFIGSHSPMLTEAYILDSPTTLEHISKTSFLVLSCYCDRIQRHWKNLPRFNNLTCLKLKICNPRIRFILGMLNNCPQLHNFVLHVLTIEEYERDWVRPASVPQCLQSSLEVFELCAYELHKSDVDMLIYFLKTGVVLKEMYLQGFEEERECLQKLLKPHIFSSSCRVTFGNFYICADF